MGNIFIAMELGEEFFPSGAHYVEGRFNMHQAELHAIIDALPTTKDRKKMLKRMTDMNVKNRITMKQLVKEYSIEGTSVYARPVEKKSKLVSSFSKYLGYKRTSVLLRKTSHCRKSTNFILQPKTPY